MTVERSNTSDGEEKTSKRYQRLKSLGTGSFKHVYMAFDRSAQRDVAWNEVQLNQGMSKSDLSMILKETEILKALAHKNILRIHETWLEPEKLVFITDIMRDGSLLEYIMNRDITLGRVKEFCRQILTALHYLHSQREPVIHRDLKCDNIFIDASMNHIVLGDLGLSTSAGVATIAKGLSVVGTPQFMAPEMYEQNYDHKVDIYAFGMCFMQMVTKEYPYNECRSVHQIFKKVSQKESPIILKSVASKTVRDFFNVCSQFEALERPTAEMLLSHPFLNLSYPIDQLSCSDRRICKRPEDASALLDLKEAPDNHIASKEQEKPKDGAALLSPGNYPEQKESHDCISRPEVVEFLPKDDFQQWTPQFTSHNYLPTPATGWEKKAWIIKTEEYEETGGLRVYLGVICGTNGNLDNQQKSIIQKKISFDYRKGEDTPWSIAKEMVDDLTLEPRDEMLSAIQEAITQDKINAKKVVVPKSMISLTEDIPARNAANTAMRSKAQPCEPVPEQKRELSNKDDKQQTGETLNLVSPIASPLQIPMGEVTRETVNRASPITSPLLSRPLGEASRETLNRASSITSPPQSRPLGESVTLPISNAQPMSPDFRLTEPAIDSRLLFPNMTMDEMKREISNGTGDETQTNPAPPRQNSMLVLLPRNQSNTLEQRAEVQEKWRSVSERPATKYRKNEEPQNSELHTMASTMKFEQDGAVKVKENNEQHEASAKVDLSNNDNKENSAATLLSKPAGQLSAKPHLKVKLDAAQLTNGRLPKNYKPADKSMRPDIKLNSSNTPAPEIGEASTSPKLQSHQSKSPRVPGSHRKGKRKSIKERINEEKKKLEDANLVGKDSRRAALRVGCSLSKTLKENMKTPSSDNITQELKTERSSEEEEPQVSVESLRGKAGNIGGNIANGREHLSLLAAAEQVSGQSSIPEVLPSTPVVPRTQPPLGKDSPKSVDKLQILDQERHNADHIIISGNEPQSDRTTKGEQSGIIQENKESDSPKDCLLLITKHLDNINKKLEESRQRVMLEFRQRLGEIGEYIDIYYTNDLRNTTDDPEKHKMLDNLVLDIRRQFEKMKEQSEAFERHEGLKIPSNFRKEVLETCESAKETAFNFPSK